MCNKAVDNYSDMLQLISECCKTQKMCDKAFNTQLSTLKLFLNVLWLKKCAIKQLIDLL